MTFGGEIEELKTFKLEKLRQVWSDENIRSVSPPIKSLMLRELSWLLQSKASGGLDAQSKLLLKSAIRFANKSTTGQSSNKKKMAGIKKSELQPGSKLVRNWQGRTYEVTVLDDGRSFSFNGETYASLTSIAKEITDAHWSGPRFFGLHKAKVAE